MASRSSSHYQSKAKIKKSFVEIYYIKLLDLNFTILSFWLILFNIDKKINLTTLFYVLQGYVNFKSKLWEIWSAGFRIFYRGDASQINLITGAL